MLTSGESKPLSYEEIHKLATAPLPAIRVSATPRGNSQAPKWAKDQRDWEDEEPLNPFDND